MSKARGGDRRSAAAMVRAAEGLHVRPSAARTDAGGIGGDAADTMPALAATVPASNEAGAPQHDAGAGLDAPVGASNPAPDLSTSDRDAGAQGNLPLPAERRRWNSLVNYPGEGARSNDAAGGGDALCASPPPTEHDPASAVEPADAAAASSSAAALRGAAEDEAALERKLDAIPAEPGVYLLRDRSGTKGRRSS